MNDLIYGVSNGMYVASLPPSATGLKMDSDIKMFSYKDLPSINESIPELEKQFSSNITQVVSEKALWLTQEF